MENNSEELFDSEVISSSHEIDDNRLNTVNYSSDDNLDESRHESADQSDNESLNVVTEEENVTNSVASSSGHEEVDVEEQPIEESEIISDVVTETVESVPPQDKLCRFPLSRIKTIMKTDPDVMITSQETTMLIAKATELFIQDLSKEVFLYTSQAKRRTVQRKDFDLAVDRTDSRLFRRAYEFEMEE